MAPYRPDQLVEEDDDLMDENQGKGIRVLGVAYAPSRCVSTQISKYEMLHASERGLYGGDSAQSFY